MKAIKGVLSKNIYRLKDAYYFRKKMLDRVLNTPLGEE